MPGSRRTRFLVVASAVLMVVALTTNRFVAIPNRLGPPVSETVTYVPGPVGHRFTAFVFGFLPHGPDPVRVRAVRITGVPEGIRIVATYGVEALGGAIHGEPDPKIYDLRPVTEIVLREGKPPRWVIAVIVEAVKPGRWQTSGLDIDWKAGGYQGTTHFKYGVGMEVEA